MSRVLLVSSDVVGDKMAGPGIRAWEFGRLLAKVHEVVLAAPPPLPSAPGPVTVVEARRSVVDREAARSDVVVVQGPALERYPGLEKISSPLVVDLYDPYLLENLEVHADRPLGARFAIHEGDLHSIRLQVAAGDFFLCASERQRYFWLGFLTAQGRINPLTVGGDPEARRLIAVAPFGLAEGRPRHRALALRGVLPGIGQDDVIALWGGGIWNWFDPLTLIRAVAAISDRHPELKLVFMGGKHPNPSLPVMRMSHRALELARDLGLLDRQVFFLDGWVGYERREDFLVEADIGVSLHLPTIETAFSFRTRILDYLWAGLPMVVSDGDVMAELVRKEELGVVARPGEQVDVELGLRRLLEDRDFRERCGASALRASEAFRWRLAAEPLLEFCRSPYTSADAGRRSAPISGGGLGILSRKGWYALRDEGPGALAKKSYRYLRSRRT